MQSLSRYVIIDVILIRRRRDQLAPKVNPRSKKKKHRSRFAKRNHVSSVTSLKDALVDEAEVEVEVEKSAPVQPDIAPAPPLKKETEVVLDKEIAAKTELKKKADSQDSTVILIYQDEKEHFLTSPQIISGKRLEPIKFRFKDFEGYDLIRVDGFTSEFVLPYAAITFTYRKKDAGNIWVFCQDIDDRHFLQKPVFVKGKIGEEFSLSAPAVRNYTLLRARGVTHGTFTYEQQAVTYFYRRDNWKNVDYTPHFLQFKESLPCLDAPDGQVTDVILAKGTIWQTFETITTDNEQRWYCLGGSIWVKYDSELMTLLERNPQTFTANKNVVTESELPTSITLQHNAMIDFIPHGELVLYDKPFGKKAATVKNGQIVTLTGRIRVDGMQWFEVNGLGWTIREYLNLDP